MITASKVRVLASTPEILSYYINAFGYYSPLPVKKRTTSVRPQGWRRGKTSRRKQQF